MGSNPKGERVASVYRKRGLVVPKHVERNRRRNALIFRMWMDHYTIQEIAKVKGLTEKTIKTIVEKERSMRDGSAKWIAKAVAQKAFDEKVAKYRLKGWSWKRIRRRLDCGSKTVMQAWERYVRSTLHEY